MEKPVITCMVEIYLDPEHDTYNTKSAIEVSKYFTENDVEIPRDVILAMICELEFMSARMTQKGDVTDEEIAEYLHQRKLVMKESSDKNYLKKKDEIDQSIDHLFEDDESDEDNANL